MLIAALDTKLPVVSIQDVSIRHEHNAFRKYGFYAWRNEEKTVLNTHYATFKNAEEAKKFVKDNVNLNHCSFEDYWIAHFYEYAHHNKKLGDSKGAESLREAADILSRLV